LLCRRVSFYCADYVWFYSSSLSCKIYISFSDSFYDNISNWICTFIIYCYCYFEFCIFFWWSSLLKVWSYSLLDYPNCFTTFSINFNYLFYPTVKLFHFFIKLVSILLISSEYYKICSVNYIKLCKCCDSSSFDLTIIF